MDFAFSNRVAFLQNIVPKTLGTDEPVDDEIVKAEKKSIEEIRDLLKRLQK